MASINRYKYTRSLRVGDIVQDSQELIYIITKVDPTTIDVVNLNHGTINLAVPIELYSLVIYPVELNNYSIYS